MNNVTSNLFGKKKKLKEFLNILNYGQDMLLDDFFVLFKCFDTKKKENTQKLRKLNKLFIIFFLN
jgi:hypothetical protein